MPTKKVRASKLETASTRRKLPIAKRPIYVKLAPNIFLGYRRNEGPGTWNVRVTGPGIDWIKKVGLADDFEPADGRAVLTYWQAQETARKLARRQPGDDAADDIRSLSAKRSTLTPAIWKREAATATTPSALACTCRQRWPASRSRSCARPRCTSGATA
jgi:hypothetical protein